MVRDIFPVSENAKVFALLILILGVSPMIAPTVGGYVTAAFGWQLIFVILAVIAALVLLAVIFGLPESHKPDPAFSLKPKPIINSFLSVLKHPQFYTYAICGAISFSGLFAYLAASPFVFMDVFGVSSKVYGWIFALLSVGFIGSNQVNTFLLRYFTSRQIVNVTLPAMVIIAFIFLIGAINGWYGIVGTIFMLFAFLSCVGLTYPNTTALSLAPFSKNTGTAAALMGTFQMAVGSFTSVVVSLFKSHSSIPMAGTILTAASIALVILIAGTRMIPKVAEASMDDEAKALIH
jgi:DHA1 family bicyclomycin/chloramphenicol resistance-like MFS transporter